MKGFHFKLRTAYTSLAALRTLGARSRGHDVIPAKAGIQKNAALD